MSRERPSPKCIGTVLATVAAVGMGRCPAVQTPDESPRRVQVGFWRGTWS